jgi:hypothetical protein
MVKLPWRATNAPTRFRGIRLLTGKREVPIFPRKPALAQTPYLPPSKPYRL